MNIRRKLMIGVAAMTATFQWQAFAETAWPKKQSVKFIVSSAAGGSLDTLMRPLAQKIGEIAGGSFIVENQGGAAGMLAAANVARSSPDGYTFMTGGIHHAIIPVAYKKVPYDSISDIKPIAIIAKVPNVVLVKSDAPYNSLQDVINAAKSSQEGLNYGTGGMGGLHHLSTEYFAKLTGVKMQPVHYKGSAPAVNDLLAGQIDLMFETMPNALGHISSGRLRALAVTSSTRSEKLPGVPTMAEAGVDGLIVNTWYGIFSPAKTDPLVIDQMNKLVKSALNSEQIKRIWSDYGAKLEGPGVENFNEFYIDELRYWKSVSNQIGFKPGE
ncbi:MAG: Bug family tripartite tricarboxylate transporter substrate binding protein [Comamonas sp.]